MINLQCLKVWYTFCSMNEKVAALDGQQFPNYSNLLPILHPTMFSRCISEKSIRTGLLRMYKEGFDCDLDKVFRELKKSENLLEIMFGAALISPNSTFLLKDVLKYMSQEIQNDLMDTMLVIIQKYKLKKKATHPIILPYQDKELQEIINRLQTENADLKSQLEKEREFTENLRKMLAKKSEPVIQVQKKIVYIKEQKYKPLYKELSQRFHQQENDLSILKSQNESLNNVKDNLATLKTQLANQNKKYHQIVSDWNELKEKHRTLIDYTYKQDTKISILKSINTSLKTRLTKAEHLANSEDQSNQTSVTNYNSIQRNTTVSENNETNQPITTQPTEPTENPITNDQDASVTPNELQTEDPCLLSNAPCIHCQRINKDRLKWKTMEPELSDCESRNLFLETKRYFGKKSAIFAEINNLLN